MLDLGQFPQPFYRVGSREVVLIHLISDTSSMKFAVDSAHRDFFKNNLAIEFQEFFTADQIQHLREQLMSSLKQRLKEKGVAFDKATSEQLYLTGRDLWRSSADLRKFVAQSKLADIAADLLEERQIRLGYDQYVPLPPSHQEKLDSAYHSLLRSELTLNSASCIQGILCGAMIALQDEPETKSPIFPTRAGNVIYFDPAAPLAFSEGCEALMIVYTRAKAQYILQPNDPNTHDFKKLGYVFGDSLKDKLNPNLKR